VPLIPGGEHLVEVKTIVAGTLYYGYTTLYVLPKLTITPEVVTVPGRVYIEVTGLQPNQLVYIYIDSNKLTEEWADENGYLYTEDGVNIPLVEAGDHVIKLRDTNGRVIDYAVITVRSVFDEILLRLDNIDGKLDGVIDVTSSIEGAVANLRDLIESSRNAVISEIQSGVALIRADISSVNDTVVYIRAKLSDLEPVITSISDNVVTILTRIGEIRANLSYIQSLIESSRDATISAIQNGVAEIKFNVTGEVGTIRARLDALNPVITDINNNVVTVITEIGVVKANLTVIKELIENSRSTILSINDNVATILTEFGTVKANLTVIKGLIEDSRDKTLSRMGEVEDTVKAIKEDTKNIRDNLAPTATLPIGVWTAVFFALLATIVSAIGITKK
jgi:predicted  nucleic acid-binding Zn-ribbon protein